MPKTAKLTISLPEELIAFADQVAKEEKISRSKVFSMCLREAAKKRREAEMAEGYLAMAKEMKQFAADSINITHEVLPEWNE